MSRWPAHKLGGLAVVVMGQSPPGATYNTDGRGLPFFQGKADFSDEHPKTQKWCDAPLKVAEPGDVLLSVRAPVGPTNVARERCCIGRGLAAIRPRSRNLAPRFLRYFFTAFESQIAQQGAGSTFDAISRSVIENLDIPLPPLPEQERIVRILDEAEAMRRLRAQADERTSQLTAALFEDMFGDPLTNPKRWQVRALGELTAHLTSGSRGWSEFTGRGNSFFIRTQDVNNGEISEHLLLVEAPDGAEADRTRLTPGDVVITITGIVGKAAVFHGAARPVYVSQHVALVRPESCHLNAEFLAAYANFPLGGVPMLARFQYGQTKPGLGFRELTTARIPVPPLDLQSTFAARVAEIRELEKQEAENRQRLDDLFYSLLHRAFQGEL